jgi:uncharacterized protein (UPF0303 family)
MSDMALIEVLRRQETELVFSGFDETTALAIGNAISARGASEGLGIVVEIRLWNRLLFAAALPGSSAANWHWVKRKVHAVERWGKSSYRALIENGRKREHSDDGANPRDYALHGGCFPILIAGVGAIGTITVSGLPEADDHRLVIDAICDHLGADKSRHALPQ